MAGLREAPAGTVDEALERAGRLLRIDPDLAASQARAILDAVPGDPRARLILGSAHRLAGDPAGARAILADLAADEPRSADTRYELALARAALGQTNTAIADLSAAVGLRPDLPRAWRTMGDLLTLAGDAAGAEAAYVRQVRASVHEPALAEAVQALADGRLDLAEQRLRAHLRGAPTDVAALRLLAETGLRMGRHADAEAILVRCLELTPTYMDARHSLALALYRQQKGREALPHLERLLAEEPKDPAYRGLLAACLGLVGEYGRAIDLYEELLAEHEAQPRIWVSLGHALRTAGRLPEAVAAYRRALAFQPGLGEAWFSLANLKTTRFTSDEEAALAVALEGSDGAGEDRVNLAYALGKALEDRSDWDGAFLNYAQGARLRRDQTPWDADDNTAFTRRTIALFTPAFFTERGEGGADAPDPIFIVGLPRSGSTLIEQILASHSAVEGTMELPEIPTLAGLLGRDAAGRPTPEAYPAVLARLTAAERTALGEAFLDRTRIQRKLGRPFFIDKMPQNFRHIGLIGLILPQARIIDARRHPMAACFSAFKQHFARGQAFSYDLADLGRYYRDYLALMRHFDTVLPGRVIRVVHEDLVTDTEGQIRRLLDLCGLSFEPACLRFFETARAVRTASSEQVRRPIYREGLDHWRHFEPWLEPLRDALGPDLATWRDQSS